ncbi:integrase [Anaerotaenia torta]|uniref:tyrosine-type recombinase/integrase n=1 Tax=Anaerotaenia torta TaxID=433293 RepID=UPI003D1A993D
MSVQKKNGRWYAAVYLGTKDGKQEYEWSEGFDKKSDAQLKELEMKKDVIEREHKVLDKASLGYIADVWLKSKEKTVAYRTYTGYKESYERYIKDEFETKIIKDIDPIEINAFMVSLDLKPASIAKIMCTLKQIFDFAMSLNYIRANPCYGIKKPNIRIEKKKTWNPKQINTFLNLPDTKEATCYTAFMILFNTGMRPGEVCGLRWSDYDGECFAPKIGIDKEGNVTELKNDKAREEVYLSPEIILHLNSIKIIQESIWKSQRPFEDFPSDTFINCFTDDWRPMTPGYLYKAFGRILVSNKITTIRLYDARHSFGTNLMRDGVNPKMVADMMRHTTVKTTLDNYSHPDKTMYKNTIKKYNKKLV